MICSAFCKYFYKETINTEYFFKLAGYDYDEPHGDFEIQREDNGIRIFAGVASSTKNEKIRYECREVGVEHNDVLFFELNDINEIVGKKFVWDSYENEYGEAGQLYVAEFESISEAEFVLESINDDIAVVYWKGIGDIGFDGNFDSDVPFETRAAFKVLG